MKPAARSAIGVALYALAYLSSLAVLARAPGYVLRGAYLMEGMSQAPDPLTQLPPTVCMPCGPPVTVNGAVAALALHQHAAVRGGCAVLQAAAN